MWNCKNCYTNNKDSVDICKECFYTINGKEPNEMFKRGQLKKKKKRQIRNGMLMVFFGSFVLGFLKGPSGIEKFYPFIKGTSYNIQDINESKTLTLNWSGDYEDGCAFVGLHNNGSDFSTLLFRGEYKLDVLDINDTLLKSRNIYFNQFSFPSNEVDDINEYVLYFLEMPVKGHSQVKIRLSTKEIPKSFKNITSKSRLVLREGSFCSSNEKDRVKELELELYIENTISRKDDNLTLKPLYQALANRDIRRIKKLFKSDFTPDTLLHGNRTAIHYASYYNDLATLHYLISRGVDINQKDIIGYTPVQYAIGRNNSEALSLLIKNGANFKTITHIPNFGIMGIGQKSKLIRYLRQECYYGVAKVLLDNDFNLPFRKVYKYRDKTQLDWLIIGECKILPDLKDTPNKIYYKKMIALYRKYGALTNEELKEKNQNGEENGK